MQPTMKEKILDAAERRVRRAGFSEMSFRDLASDVGIKSASVHYHFPTKFDLGDALVERYAENFADRLEAIDQTSLKAALDGYVALYADALVLGESICLCAIMGAEAMGMPGNVNARTTAFFTMNTDWLEGLFEAQLGDRRADEAAMIVSALEGAMIVASVSQDRAFFERTARTALRFAEAPRA